jgi:hypothetical protein
MDIFFRKGGWILEERPLWLKEEREKIKEVKS